MRHGIPLVGNSLQQELVIMTGLADAFVVDVQCIFPNIENVAENFHTKIITTMKEARLSNSEHVPFEEERADELAKRILNIAIENFPLRGKIRKDKGKEQKGKEQKIFLPKEEPKELIGGFSTEACLDILSRINHEDPLKPLIDNIISGDIYGIVLFAGCLNPRVTTYETHATIAKELMKRNVLIIATGCAASECARAGLMTPEASQQNFVGKNLKNVLNLLGKVAGLEKPLPPVLFFGSCVDNSRPITFITAIAQKLGVPIKDLPIAASVAECMTEKGVAIGIGAVGLGITVHVGVPLPIIGSPAVTALLTQKELFDGRFIVETDPIKASQQLLEHISEARTTLGLAINTYQPLAHISKARTVTASS
jgi:carbon-monoxide dehydrogenase catalytic subunit